MCSKFGGLTSFGSFTLSLHRHYFSCSKSCHVYEIATAAKFAAKKEEPFFTHCSCDATALYAAPKCASH